MKGILLFAGKFLLFAPVCLVLWWLFMPFYAEFMGVGARLILNLAWSMGVDATHAAADGILRTDTALVFVMGERERPLEIGPLVTNLPVFAALVLATGGLGWRRLLATLAGGGAILIAGHLIFIVLAFRYSAAITAAPQLPSALGEVLITLPFVLWIALVYWRRIWVYVAGAEDEAAAPGRS